MSLLEFVPQPGRDVDWQSIRDAFAWAEAMHDTPQEPNWHAEGDVGIHTRMVLEELVALETWQELGESDRATVFLACLLHDVGKPEVTRRDLDGCWTSRGHSRRGAIQAREIMWRMGVPFEQREQVCGLVAHHQWPFFLIDRDDRERGAIYLSYAARNDLLALVAEADARGRIAEGKPKLLENIELFREYVFEVGCANEPYGFASDHSRFEFFRNENRDPRHHARPDPEFEVTVMSGLPASGKDHWLKDAGLEVISLDEVRSELGIDPRDPQGKVIDVARERARAILREKQPFAWNATNLSQDIRGRIVGLAADYGAAVRIVYTETTAEEQAGRNRKRSEPIPERALQKMLRHWQVPTLHEAHTVDWQIA